MTIIVPPGFAHIDLSFRHSLYQRDAHCTYGVNIGENPEQIADFCLSAWMSAMNAHLDNNVTMREVTATIGQDGGDPLIDTALNTTPGGRSAESTPPALALLLTKRSGVGGRRNTGRMFLPWFNSEASVSETGIVAPSTMTSYQTAVTAWLAFHTNGTVPMVILHRTGISTPPSPTPVTQLVASNVISTQVRRQVRNVN